MKKKKNMQNIRIESQSYSNNFTNASMVLQLSSNLVIISSNLLSKSHIIQFRQRSYLLRKTAERRGSVEGG